MTHVHEDLGAYVLGMLDSAEAQKVQAHLAECESCAAEHANLSGLPRLLDLAVVAGAGEEDPLPPAIEERVLDRFARERPPARSRRGWRPRIALGIGSAFAGAAVAAAVLLLALGYQSAPKRPGIQYRLALHATGTAPVAAKARASLRTVSAGTVLRLWVYNLPAQKGDTYEVLCESKKWSASAGTFSVDAKGNAYVILTTSAKRGQYDSIRIVRRSPGAAGVVQSNVLDGKLS
jgi:hypothetical protein